METENETKSEESPYFYENGVCFYRDPVSGSKYEWNERKQTWGPITNSTNGSEAQTTGSGTATETTLTIVDSAAENQSGKTGMENYEFDGKTYLYKQPDTGVLMKWNLKKKEWFPADTNAGESSDEDKDTDLLQENQPISINPNEIDKNSYEWDAEKRAWIPKIDDEFLARYQLSYGISADTEPSEPTSIPISTGPATNPVQKPEEEKEVSHTKRKAQAGWFDVDEAHNTKVYVSNLPTDITENEFVDVMQKCGLVMKELDSKNFKIKLYKDHDGKLKGDALCNYIKIESVELALTILDGYEVRGKKISVERAKFNIKGAYDPSKKPRKKSKKTLEKLKKKQEMLFAWKPDKLKGERGKHERVVVIRNVFDPAEFEKNPALLLERQTFMRQECAKYGDLKKIILHDRSPEGIVQAFYKDPEDADRCIQFITGRLVDGRKIKAEPYDGVTNYKAEETETEREERLANWSKFLDDEAKAQENA